MRYTRAMPDHAYPRPALTVDVVAVRMELRGPEVLLVQRGGDPFAGMWALPGGFVDQDEPLDEAALRELAEETGLRPSGCLTQVGAYGDPGRDPRGWTVSVVFAVTLGAGESTSVCAGDDAAAAAWYAASELPHLAFDHDRVVTDALASM